MSDQTGLWALLACVLVAALAVAVLPEPGLEIIAPRAGTDVGLPAQVTVTGAPDGTTVVVRLTDGFGRPLGEEAGAVHDGRVALELYYDRPAGQRGWVEVFLPPAEKAAARRPVTFAPVRDTWLRVYFLDAGGRAFPLIRRVPATPAVARAALEQLLDGPSWREQQRGYWSALPAGTRLEQVSLVGTTAEVVLSSQLLASPRGLRRLACRQIELTLTTFPTIEAVRVVAGGRPVCG